MKNLAIIITHPIQYYVPLFRLLAAHCNLKVFYTWGEKGAIAKYDPDFKQVISWDLPLLNGYEYKLLDNTAKNPGSHHFQGIVNPNLIEEIKEFAPNAILVYGWAYQSHLKTISYFKGKIPIWFRGDSTLINERLDIKNTLRKVFLSWIYKHVDKAFYVGTANKKYFEKFGLKANQLVIAPHAVDNTRFEIDRISEANALRTKLNIKEDEILILFAGKLEEKKNPLLLLQAFQSLNHPNLHVMFVGSGHLDENLKAESLKHKALKNTIHFLGFQNQNAMPSIYQSCDLFCLPSKSETWGLAVNEAMASGKAILVSNKVGCAIDLVKNKENGYIFESGNLDDLKEKLVSLSTNKNLLVQMGIKSKEIIQNWTIPAQSTAILKELNL